MEATNIFIYFVGEELAQMTSPASEGNNNSDIQDDTEEVVLTEISPLVSYAGEGLEPLVSGKRLVPPIHLTSSSY